MALLEVPAFASDCHCSVSSVSGPIERLDGQCGGGHGSALQLLDPTAKPIQKIWLEDWTTGTAALLVVHDELRHGKRGTNRYLSTASRRQRMFISVSQDTPLVWQPFFNVYATS